LFGSLIGSFLPRFPSKTVESSILVLHPPPSHSLSAISHLRQFLG
jgi:hypothetical protein